MKNKWKIVFWISFFFLILISLFGFYQILDQGVTLTYMKEGYTSTENDLNTIIEIVNKTDLSKSKINNQLKKHPFYEFMDFKTDTIKLETVQLIFQNNKLSTIKK